MCSKIAKVFGRIVLKNRSNYIYRMFPRLSGSVAIGYIELKLNKMSSDIVNKLKRTNFE